MVRSDGCSLRGAHPPDQEGGSPSLNPGTLVLFQQNRSSLRSASPATELGGAAAAVAAFPHHKGLVHLHR